MHIDTASVINGLDPGALIRIANELRPSGDYLFSQLLPERQSASYSVEGASIVVRATAAGQVGTSSPYPPAGAMTATRILQGTFKIATKDIFEEQSLRELQALRRLYTDSVASKERLVDEVLNWYQKVILQGLYDRGEWLRARALIDGEIDWTHNNLQYVVDYNLPADNIINRSGNQGYAGNSSAFWNDWRKAQGLLGYSVSRVIMHPMTWDVIVSNPVNNFNVQAQSGNVITVGRFAGADTNVLSQDYRDRLEITLYAEEYEELLGEDEGGGTVRKPFIEPGEILVVGDSVAKGYRVGQGSTDNPDSDNALGYFHVGPTTEGDGQPGRWGRVFVPEDAQWSIVGEATENSVPVRLDISDGRAKTVTMKTTFPKAA